MAQRRMFHKDVVESDRFLDLPPGTQLLYFHLGMQADDDGFINGPKQICRKLKRPFKDLQLLIERGFLLNFDGIVVIKHFRVANNLKSDRIRPFVYPEIAKQIFVGPTKEYFLENQGNYESLYEMRWKKMDSKKSPRREEKKREENNSEEMKGEEENPEQRPDEPSDKLRYMNGRLGKGVVLLTERQIEDLLKRLDLDAFDFYVEKLANYLLKKQVKIANHYETILQWYEEDRGIRK